VDSQGLYSNPVQFYDFLQNRVLILFKPKVDDADLPEFELMLSKKMNYDIVRHSTRSWLFSYKHWLDVDKGGGLPQA
jgi:ubiquitin carboxyl-terminal hydrolase 7